MTKLYESYAVEENTLLKFTVDRSSTMSGIFYIYASGIYGKTTNNTAVISINIAFEPIP